MARTHASIIEAFGGTPLVRLNRVTEGIDATVYAKLEFYNPSSSVKDRLAIAIVDAAVESGALQPGGTIVEGTSGNTGIGLAMVCAARGFKAVLTMPESMSVERRKLLRAYGAELVLTPAGEGMKGAVARAEQIVAERPGAVLARQFENEANPRIHYATTGPEIWSDTDGEVDVFVSGVGTGGTITGTGRYLKEQKPGIRIVAVEPKESPILNGGKPGPHKIQGIGPNFVPAILDREIYDEVVDVDITESVAMARRLAAEEGILAGISSGSTVHAALEVARRPENGGKTFVVVVASSGERYLSTVLYEDLDV
ncbi:cysteine synthase A [Amnibacterium soli]|uniref:Cysteine synthase n=1 Tax=Amnibacterium soli TaxID=1282736 RepID=A0ABP8YXD4_9MICO